MHGQQIFFLVVVFIIVVGVALAALMIFSVILLAERMARPSYWPITSNNLSLSLPRSGR